jgi:hypothetical protein
LSKSHKMKQFSLQLTWRDPNDAFKFKESSIVESDDIVHLLTQFHFVLYKVVERLKSEEYEKLKKELLKDDDIPF